MKHFLFWLFFAFATLGFSQQNILIVDYANSFSSDQNAGSGVYNRLTATQTSVTRVSAMPVAMINAQNYEAVYGDTDNETGGAAIYTSDGGTILVSTCPGNLVPNPSFESYSNIPTTLAQYGYVDFWNNAGGSIGSPDYFHLSGLANVGLPNAAFGTVYPRTDSAIMGFLVYVAYKPNWREYINAPLTTPLTPGVTYDISFYVTNGVNNGDYLGMSSNNIGVHLSVGAVTQTGSQPMGITPTYNNPDPFYDSTWVQMSFQYTPTTAVDYITFGNFFDDAATTADTIDVVALWASSYLFIDDICVTPVLISLIVSNGGTICIGDSTLLTAANSSTGYIWVDSLTFTQVLSTDSFYMVSPTVTTTYAVYNATDTVYTTVEVYDLPILSFVTTDETCEDEDDGAVNLTVTGGTSPFAYSWDDLGSSNTEDLLLLPPGVYTVIVTDANLCIASGSTIVQASTLDCADPYMFIPNIFSPNNDGENDKLFVLGDDITGILFIIYDRWGEAIFETTDISRGWDGTFNDLPMNEAVFVYYVKATFNNGDSIEQKGNLTLVR